MTNQLWVLLMLVTGYIAHALFKTYELDRATVEKLTPLDVYWDGPERWKTIGSVLVILVLAFTDSTSMLFGLLGVTVADRGDAWLLFVALGANVDMAAGKIFALGKKKLAEEA